MARWRKMKRKAWNRFADVGRAALVTAAIALPRRTDANRDRVNAAGCMLAIKLLTQVLKEAVPEQRPDDEDNQSFPSEHAAESAAAALIIAREYSGGVAAGAWALAGAIGLARIESGKHFPRDVAAGALIGLGAAALAMRRKPMIAVE